MQGVASFGACLDCLQEIQRVNGHVPAVPGSRRVSLRAPVARMTGVRLQARLRVAGPTHGKTKLSIWRGSRKTPLAERAGTITQFSDAGQPAF